MYQQLLQEHIDDKKAYGESPQPAAGPAQLQALRARAKKELGVDLPAAYLELLKITDGLDSNGMVIYGSETRPIVGYEEKDRLIQGIVDANLIWRDYPPHAQWLFFGDSGISMYGLDLEGGKYQILDRASNSLVEEFPSFEGMLARALEENHP
jgi:hypothetical protein